MGRVRQRRGPSRKAVRAGVIALFVTSFLVAFPPLRTSAATCPTGAVACDSFNRVSVLGWGAADTGGLWNGFGTNYSVSNGFGSMVSNSSGTTNILTSVSVRDVDMLAMISPPPITSAYQDDGILVRYKSSGSSWYQVNAFYSTANNGGKYTVQLKRKPGNTSIRPDVNTSVPGGTPYWFRLEAQGANPTILRWRMWANGTTEPASWTDIGVDSTGSQQAAGALGVIGYASTGTSTVKFSSLAAVPLSSTPAITTCPQGTTACDSYNRTTSNGWGSADQGGAWSASGAKYAVTPGSGTIAADSTTPSTFLASVSMQDIDLRARITPPAAASAYVSDGVAVRYAASSGTWYQLTTYDNTQTNGGSYVVQLTRKPDNVAIRPDFSTGIAGGLPYWLRLQAVGINPTTLHWKIWADGTTEPAAWTDTGVDANAAQQVAGGIGAVAYASSGSSTIAFNGIQASVPTGTTPPRIVACPNSPIACDSFNRSVANGWGSADTGGAWGTTGSQYQVIPGSGSIAGDSTAPGNFLDSVSAQDADVLALVTPPAISGAFVSVAVDVRHQASSGSWYQVAAYYSSGSNGGNYTVQVVSKPSNTSIRPDYTTAVAGGTPFWLRIEVQGTSPTALRWRLWADGTTEPQSWTDSGVDSTAALQAAGGVGLAAYASSGTAPVSFNALQVTSIGASSTPLVPCPTSAVACDSFNRSVVNGWGTPDIGPAWSSSGSQYSVAPGNGDIVGDSTSPLQTFSTLSIQDVDALVLVAPPAGNGSQYQDDGVMVRYSAGGGTWYQVNAFFNTGYNGGNYAVQLKRKPDNTQLRPEVDTSIAGGTPYWMRLEAQGVNPTTLRWKMWPAGASEPAAWADSGTDSTAAEQGAGSAGVIAYASSGTSSVLYQSVQVAPISTTPPPPPPTVTCPASPVACDTYARTVSGGWGTADTGGAWTITGTAANWGVAPGTGTVTVAAGGAELGVLGSVSVQDVEILQEVALPRSTQSNNDDAYVVARYKGGTAPTYYRVGVGQGAGGQMILRAQRADNTSLGADMSTGITAADGAAVWLRVQLQGTNPTAIRARAWLNGSAEPTGWTLDTTDSDAAEQAAGAVGVRDRNEDTTAAHAFRHGAFQAVAMSAAAALCPASATVCDTFQRTTSNGWGTANKGGAWSSTGSIYSVVPGRASIVVNSSAPQTFLPLANLQDVDARLWVSPPPFGATGDAGIAVRYNTAGGAYYQVSVYYPSGRNGSNYVVQLKRKPENVLINPDFNISIPGGTAIWIRLEAQGTNPTTLRWKIWQDGTPEPSGWTATGTDSNSAEQGAGGVGVEGYVSSGTASVAFNSISAGPIQ